MIAPTPETNNAIFTYNSTAKTLRSKSGKYIGRTTDSNGLDAGDVVPFTIITFDTTKYHNGDIDTLISRVNVDRINEWSTDSLYRWSQTTNYKYKTDAQGVFEYTLPYPALLIVNAIKVEAIKDTLGNILEYVKHTGTIQVQVDEGETTEKTLLMVETN